MKSFFLLSAAAIGAANAGVLGFRRQPRGDYNLPQVCTTSTAYATQTLTVGGCPEHVQYCPNPPQVTTKVVAVPTTICPVTQLETPVDEPTGLYPPPEQPQDTEPAQQDTTQYAPTEATSEVPPPPEQTTSKDGNQDTTQYAPPPVPTVATSEPVENTDYAPPGATTEVNTKPANEDTTEAYTPTDAYPPPGNTPSTEPGNESTVEVVTSTDLYPPPAQTDSTKPAQEDSTEASTPTSEYAPPESTEATKQGSTDVGSSTDAYPPPNDTKTTQPGDEPTTKVSTETTQPAEAETTEAASASTTEWTTSTVYTTNVYTVTSCPPEVPNCPGTPHVTTKTIAVSTTICPVTETKPVSEHGETESPTPDYPVPESTVSEPTETEIETETETDKVPEQTESATSSGAYPPPKPTTEAEIESSTGIYPPPKPHTETEDVDTETATSTGAYPPPEPTTQTSSEGIETETNYGNTESTQLVPETSTGAYPPPKPTTVTGHEATETETVSENPSQTKPYGEETSQWTTSTIYTTNIRTITSCAPEVPDCPNTPHITTETVAISTTICPVTEEQPTQPEPTKPATETEEQPTKSVTEGEEEPTKPVTDTEVEYTQPATETEDQPTKPVTGSGELPTQPQPTKPATETATEIEEQPTYPVTDTEEVPTQPGATESASTTEWTTSTVYTTNIRVVTSCAPEVPDCPGTPHTTTETIAISTTVCPVTEEVPTKPATYEQPTKPATGGESSKPEPTKPVTQEQPTKPATQEQPTKPVTKGQSEAASTQPASTREWTTSTVYTTSVRTVTSCAPGVPDCPLTPHVTTETIAISTTVCPVTEQQQTEPAPTEPKPTEPKPTEPKPTEPKPTEPAKTTEWTTSTVYTTSVRTVTTCGPDVPDCPQTPHVTTETIAISTTVCPVTEDYPAPTKPAGGDNEPQPPAPTKPAGDDNEPQPPAPTKLIITTGWSTSTVYQTQVRTVTACGPNVANCPGTPHVTTETVALSTTLCPVTRTQVVPVPGVTNGVPAPHYPGNSTSTLYTTKYFTITACPPKVTDCPIGEVTSTVYATATTQVYNWNPSNSNVYQPPHPTKVVPPVVPTYLPGNQTTTFYRSTTKLYETPVKTPGAVETPHKPASETPAVAYPVY
ncbi:hypothetical protein F66182_7430 [Fusarium sp. NRRL 66182]|nr:hypothetical protein F66182_7430 [Fusarium sp. NRRL 66182]